METVALRASGDIQFFSSFGNPITKTEPLKVDLLPGNWDLKTNFIYDLTSGLRLTNNTKNDLTLDLSITVEQQDGNSQCLASIEKTRVIVKSGTTEMVLIAINAVVQREGREVVVITVDSGSSAVETVLVRILMGYDANANTPLVYQITTAKTLTFSIGQTVDLPLISAYGLPGEELWEVNDPSYLLTKGLILTPAGRLVSNGIKGPTQQRKLVFSSRREIAPRQRIYAAKAITVIVVN
jgi:hypothetical protein